MFLCSMGWVDSTTNSRRNQLVAKKKIHRDSIYNLDKWKDGYEPTKVPKNRVHVTLKQRIKHAWKVLRG